MKRIAAGGTTNGTPKAAPIYDDTTTRSDAAQAVAQQNDQRLSDLPRSVDTMEYLNPELWRTVYDDAPHTWCGVQDGHVYADAQYQKGLKVGGDSERVYIAYNGTWGAIGKDGSWTTSYEVIGYHRNTADLLKGFLDSGVPFYVYQPYLSHPPIGREEERGVWINKPAE